MVKDADLTLVNENFRAALASAPVPLLLLNGAARIVLASKSLEQLLGRDAAGLIGLPVEQVLHQIIKVPTLTIARDFCGPSSE